MKRNLSKALALVLSTALLFSLSACGSDNKGGTDAGKTSSQGSQVGEKTAQPDEKPVTLKYWAAYDGGGTSGIHNDPIIQEVEKRTGVIIDFEFNLKQDTYNARLASGDLPDIMTVWTKDVKNLIDGNNIIDMEPLLAEHGKDIKADTGKVEFGKRFLSEGQNKLYFVPIFGLGLDAQPAKSFNSGTGIGAYIRWDVYKEAGYPELQGSFMDLIPVLKQMQDKHPKNAEGKKVYALSPWLGDWGLWSLTIYPQGFNSVFAEAGGFTDINCKTSEITSQIGNTDSSLWQGAKFFNKAYQAGILDPDSLMQKYDQSQDKQNAGRVLMGPCNWAVAGANGAFAKNGTPDQGFIALKMPSNYTMLSNLYKNPYTDRWAMAITSKCQNKEKAMDFINFVNSKDGMRLLLNGIEGENWKVGNDGVPRLTEETLKMFNESTPQDLEAKGFNCYTHLYGYSDKSWDSKYNCQAFFKNNEDPEKLMGSATPYEKDYAQHYGVAYPDQIFEKTLPDQKLIFDGSFMQMVEQTPAEIKQIDDKLQNYLIAKMVQIITSKNDAAFEEAQKKILEDCKNMGYEKAFDWHKKDFETAMGKVKDFYKAIGK